MSKYNVCLFVALIRQNSVSKTIMSQRSRQEPNTDKGWAWVILIAVFLNCFVCGIVYTTGIFNVLFLELFGETRAKTSFCAALPTSLICFVAPFVSLLTNYIGPRMTVMLGSLMIFSGLTITAFMQSFGAVIVTYGVMLGLGFALIYTPSLVIIGFYFKKYRNIAYGIVNTGIGSGFMTFGIVIELLIQHYGNQAAMLLLAAICSHCCIAGALLRPYDMNDVKDYISDTIIYTDQHAAPDSDTIIYTDQHAAPDSDTIIYTDQHAAPDSDTIIYTDQHAAPDYGTIIYTDQHTAPDSGTIIFTDQHAAPVSDTIIYKNSDNLANNQKQGFASDTIRDMYETQSKMVGENIQVILTHIPIENVENCGVGYHFENTTNGSIGNRNNYTGITADENILTLLTKSVNSAENSQDQSTYIGGKQCLKFILSLPFMLLSVNLFLADIGLACIYVHFPAYILSLNKTASMSPIFLAMGIGNIISRLLTGILTNGSKHRTFYTYVVFCALAGVTSLLGPYICRYYIGQIIFAFTFAFFGNAFVGLMCPLIIDLFGLDNLNSGFGLGCGMCGLGLIVGPPLAGMIYDASASYYYTFIMAGVCYIISGAVMLLIPFMKRINK